MPIMEPLAGGDIVPFAGTPGAGTSEVQTLTIGGTPTGGTFKLGYGSSVTAAIPWVAVNATLLASIQSALDALAEIGSGNTVVAAGTVTAGIGTITITFQAGLAAVDVPLITVANNAMTGTSPTAAVATTTPGVTATMRGAQKGVVLVDTTTGLLYVNTGTPAAPIWTKVGTQT